MKSSTPVSSEREGQDPQNQTRQSKTFPIALAQEDERVRICAFRTGKGMEHKLRDMGLPIGAEVRVVQHKGAGVVLAAHATRIALGASAAQLVYVELIDQSRER